MIASLLHHRAYPHPTATITLLETHISWVLLTGPCAYKVKKPVALGFVDFSTLERRHLYCQEELRLNRRLAPDLYLDLVTIHGPAERATVQGGGPVIEVAVRMRQFEQHNLLPRALAAGAVTADQLESFAERLARFHGEAAVAPPEGPFGTPEAVIRPALANLEVLAQHQALDCTDLSAWTHAEARRLEPIFADRLARGRVREGHGDLHLGNLVLHQGQVMGFDCLEFNPALRWIDGLSDVAFLAMDLQRLEAPVLAGRVLNRWLSTGGDYGALACWRWYLTYRALVRAKVLALRLEQVSSPKLPERQIVMGELGAFLLQAHRSSGSAPAGTLLLTHGVSGSGKSHLARVLSERHGWIHLRSDVERRRLFGRWGTSLEPVRQGDAYAPAITAEIYGKLLPAATEAVLSAGLHAVVDATFLKGEHRRIFWALADRLKAPWLILSCSVSLAVAQERLSQRRRQGGDPSEADLGVLMEQWTSEQELSARESERALVVSGVEAAEEQLRMRQPELFAQP